MSTRAASWLSRVQIVAAVGFLAAATGLAVSAVRSPAIPLLPTGDGPWMGPPSPPQTVAFFLRNDDPVAHARFERRFPLETLPERLSIRLRALREVLVRVNGRAVPLPAAGPRHWKEAWELDLAPFLVAGENVLQVEVRNPSGLPLLQAQIGFFGEDRAATAGWLAGWEGRALEPAAIADDVTHLPAAAALPTPLAALRAHRLVLALLGAAGAALFVVLRGRSGALAPACALALVAAFWLHLGARVAGVPADVGFDAGGHVEYVGAILAKGRLPSPSEGMLTYHPPLHHVATAALLAVVRPAPGSVAQRALLSLLPLFAGLGMAFVAARLARSLAPQAPWLVAGTTVAAGFLPMSLTLAATPSNELPHAFLASVAVLVTIRAILAPEPRRRDDLLQGLVLGAALLTKYTSALLVPLLVGALALARWLDATASRRQVVAGAARALAVAAALSGWLYARNLLVYGDAFVSPLTAFPDRTLWQYPGFHTPAYFLRFGDVFTAPWYAGFHGFWDSLYATLFGDGMLSGASAPATARLPWRYDWMAAGFLLAAPAAALMAGGWLRVARDALRGDDVRRRVALSLLAALPAIFLLSLVGVNLRYPFWSFPKAFYALFLTPVLALFGALGLEALDRVLAQGRLRLLRPLPWAFAAALFGTIAIAYGT